MIPIELSFVDNKKNLLSSFFYQYAPLILLLTYFTIHISFESIGDQNNISFAYYFDFKKNQREFFQPKSFVEKSIFHTESDPKNFRVVSLNESGVLQNNITIPRNSGYITYPNDASFFLWYPRLGSQVKIYNGLGEVLWEINESRYIQISQHGKYVLAFSGDGSRIEFLRPDMSSIVAVEGFLLHSYQLYEKNNAETSYQACVGFLNGDIGFVNLRKGSVNRLSLKKPLKALHCDFESGYLVAQVGGANDAPENLKEKNNDSNDKLIQINFDSLSFSKNKISNQYDTQFEIDLGSKFPISLPLTLWQNHLVGVIPTSPHKFAIQFFDESGSKVTSYEWPSEFPDYFDIETFRLDTTKERLIASSHSTIMIFNDQGVIHKQKLSEIQKILVKKKSLFIQTDKGIISFKI